MHLLRFFYVKLACFGLPLWGLLGACGQSSQAPSLFTQAKAQTPTRQNLHPPLDSGLQASINAYDRFFRAEMARTQMPGAALVIVKDSQIIFMHGYGVSVFGTADSIGAHTVFRIGSLSKGFASVLTGILVQNGVLNWDEPVQKHFPGFTLRDKKQAQRTQLQHLLSQTSGLPYQAYTNLIEAGYDIPTIVRDYFPRAPLSGREGEVYAYQNAAYCVIEEVMRGATGRTYQDLLTEKILLPAGMTTSSCDYQRMHQCSDKTFPHTQIGNGSWRCDSISQRYYNAAAAGGINASINDMAQWLKVLLGQRPDIVADSTLNQVFAPRIRTEKERRILPGWISREEAWYAMGWRVLQHGGETYIYHGGYVNGFRSEIAFNRREKLGICVLMNAPTELAGVCVPTFFREFEQKE